jgi:hypothetical protein
MKQFLKFLIIWVSQNLSIPFMSMGMNIIVVTGFILDYKQQKQ